MLIKVFGKELFVLWHRNQVRDRHNFLIMEQLAVIGFFGFQLRVHCFYQGDGNLFHTHPRHFASLCVAGEYREVLLLGNGKLVRDVFPGTITIRNATTPHNVKPIELPCRTIAIVSPIINKWEKFECK